MAYTNSPLVSYTKFSPNHSGQRTHSIDCITPHCVVGQLSAEAICDCFSAGRDASCNYGIGTDGRVSLCVEEKNRSWCSSSSANDQRAVTIECASDRAEPYAMNSAVYATLIKLCTDICRRNGKKKLLWFGDKNETLNYSPKSDEMVITVHRWFANKSCPGNWLYARLGDLAAKVTAALGGTQQTPSADTSAWYRVRKTWADAKSQKGAFHNLAHAKTCADKNAGYFVFDDSGKILYPTSASVSALSYMVKVAIPDLNIRRGPGINYAKTGKYTGIGSFTIVEESIGQGASKWGKLKSGAGWISLDYCKKIKKRLCITILFRSAEPDFFAQIGMFPVFQYIAVRRNISILRIGGITMRKSNHAAESIEIAVPISEKYTLTIKEAALYFNIGVKKMRRLAEENLGRYAIYSGNRYLIIRTKFEKFIDESSAI